MQTMTWGVAVAAVAADGGADGVVADAGGAADAGAVLDDCVAFSTGS